eukprot:TRINITY_DN78229_c0_g1_i1.p2 TRINITY_DN78229_c0_g1~~TRINITY_DN78229_c0_g1_i1.p2  ORF type:complete len:110 (+),score=40.95 TRINITY_DN78229_c0_g1_i1:86-415(+)
MLASSHGGTNEKEQRYQKMLGSRSRRFSCGSDSSGSDSSTTLEVEEGFLLLEEVQGSGSEYEDGEKSVDVKPWQVIAQQLKRVFEDALEDPDSDDDFTELRPHTHLAPR